MSEDLKPALHTAISELKAAGAREVYLFGSGARGQGVARDLDLAVSGLPSGQFFRAQGRLLCLLKRPVDLVNLDHLTPFTRYLRDAHELVRVG